MVSDIEKYYGSYISLLTTSIGEYKYVITPYDGHLKSSLTLVKIYYVEEIGHDNEKLFSWELIERFNSQWKGLLDSRYWKFIPLVPQVTENKILELQEWLVP